MNSLSYFFLSHWEGRYSAENNSLLSKILLIWKSVFQAHLGGLNCYHCGYVHTRRINENCVIIPTWLLAHRQTQWPGGEIWEETTNAYISTRGWAGKRSVFERFRWTVCVGVQGDNNCVIVEMLQDQPTCWMFSIFFKTAFCLFQNNTVEFLKKDLTVMTGKLIFHSEMQAVEQNKILSKAPLKERCYFSCHLTQM